MFHMQGKSIKASHISAALLSPEDVRKQWLNIHYVHPSKVCPLFSGCYVLAEEKLPQHQNLKAQIALISWQMPPGPHLCWMCLSFSAGWTKTVIAIHCFSTIKHQSKSQSNKLGSITETALMELCIPVTLPKRPCHLSRRSFAFTQKGSAPQRYPRMQAGITTAVEDTKRGPCDRNEKLQSSNRQITLHAFSVS